MSMLELIKPGTYTAMNGRSVTFGEAELAASAAAYDPALHEAPLVVGHPTDNAPAYGWVKRVDFSDGSYQAEPDQVDAAFAELVAAGRFKKISASFYLPEAANNPKPGVYYLRHVGFLGAMPPAVKGLKAVSFGEEEPGVVEFAGFETMQNAGLWRRLREFLISKFSIEEADQVVPGYAVEDLEAAGRRNIEEPVATIPSFSEPPTEEDDMKTEELAAKAAELAAKEASFAEREAAIKAKEQAAVAAEHAAFCDALVQQGRLLPRDRAFAHSFLCGLSAEAVVEFGEGEERKQQPQAEAFKAFLSALPPLVDLAERAGAEKGEPPQPLTDPHQIAKAALEFQESETKAGRTVSLPAAVAHVARK